MKINHVNIGNIRTNKAPGAGEPVSVSVQREKKESEGGCARQNPQSVKKTRVANSLFSADFLEKVLDKVNQASANVDVAQIKDQITQLSNTVTPEIIEKLAEKGCSLSDTQVDTIVTVMDRIKMELAKGGMDISVFGEHYSMKKLEAIAGGVVQARQMADALHPCKDSDIKYIIGNELEPTVNNFYLAQHSGEHAQPADVDRLKNEEQLLFQTKQMIKEAGLPINDKTLAYGSFLLENGLPLTPRNVEYVDRLKNWNPAKTDALEPAVQEAMSQGKAVQDAMLLEGYSWADRAKQAAEVVNGADEQDLRYVIEKEMPLSLESLRQAQLYRHSEIVLDDSEERIVDHARNDRRAIQDKHDRQNEEVQGEDIRFITARRRLEEVRLAMTAAANHQLIKQGINIETQELEALVEDLKSVESNYYKSLLEQSGIQPTTENVELFQEVAEKTEELKSLPAYALGGKRPEIDTINTLYEEGKQIQAQAANAGQAYETMMTAPRADLGDSIRQAFRNVGDMLQGLQLTATPANERAVRILGYNRLEITPESIAQMKEADQKVQLLFRNMTPSVVMELIREGRNPLETDLNALNARAEEIRTGQGGNEEEKFSKYLWKLEQKNQIAAEEKESYIGIYRLLKQIDKTDGAVIGALVNQGGELSLKNLLTALRTRKAHGINANIDDDFGLLHETSRSAPTISEQIESAYQTDCAKEAFSLLTQEGMEALIAQKGRPEEGVQEMTPEQLLWNLKENVVPEENEASYLEQQMQGLKESVHTEQAILNLLKEYDIPMSASNLYAATQMMNHRNTVFRNLFSREELENDPNLSEAKDLLLQKFSEALTSPEEMEKAQEALAETAERVMEGMADREWVTSLDVRDMKILRQQIQMSTKMAKEENYAIPVLINGELTSVQLKIVRGTKKPGRVDVLFETERLGKVAARFSVEETRTNAYVLADSQEAIRLLQAQEEAIKSALEAPAPVAVKDGIRLDFVESKSLDLTAFSQDGERSAPADHESERYQVQTARLYGMAKGFLEIVKQIAF